MTTGTAANVIGLRAVTHSFQSVICADTSHLHKDECGAPEYFLGSKLLIAEADQGKLTVPAVEPLLADRHMVHRVQPKVLSIAQCTEYGTVYSPDEIAALARFCHDNGLLLHMDGARLCNAAAGLDLSLRQLTTDAGVDLLSFGVTKNGALAAESVVVLNPECAPDLAYYRKQGMQLLSKMRFVSVQFTALLEDNLWRENALHANTMARRLADGVVDIPGVELVVPQQTNGVFARVSEVIIKAVQPRVAFNVWESATSTVRWMTSFDTTREDIDHFVKLIRLNA